MVVLCCIVVVTGFLPFPVSRSSLSSPPSQVYFLAILASVSLPEFLGKGLGKFSTMFV